jgi:hypothetical protein
VSHATTISREARPQGRDLGDGVLVAAWPLRSGRRLEEGPDAFRAADLGAVRKQTRTWSGSRQGMNE